MKIKMLILGAAAVAASLGAKALDESGTTFADFSAGDTFAAASATEDGKYWWQSDYATSGKIATWSTLGSYTGTRADKWAQSQDELALSLETTSPLFRGFTGRTQADDALETVSADGVYIDTLIQIGIQSNTPSSVPSGVKFALWAENKNDAETLVVRAGKYENEELAAADYDIVTPANFDFDAWHRVTVKTFVDDGKTLFKLYVDGVLMQTADGDSEFPGLVEGTVISAIGYDGVGAVDDIVVTESVPRFAASAAANGVNYESLQQAIDAASENWDTVELLANYAGDIILRDGEGFSLRVPTGVAFTGDVLPASSGYQVALTGTDEGDGYTEYTYESTEIPAPAGIILLISQGAEDQYFETLAEAVAAAQSGDTIKLLNDVALTATVLLNNNLTIDLNGNDITATNCRAIWVQSGVVEVTGTGTISTDVSQGTALASSSSVIRVGYNNAEAQFTLGENVTVTSPYCYGITYFGTQAQTVTINGTVSVTGVQAALSGNGSASYAEVALVVNGTVSATQDYAIYNPQAGTTTINGTVNGGIEIKAGTVTIADGATVSALDGATPSHQTNNDGTSTSGYAIAAVGNSSYKQPANAEIRDGATITGQVIVLAENNSSTSGSIASYSNQIAIPAGYKWEAADNGYTLVEISGYESPDGDTFTVASEKEASLKEALGVDDLGAKPVGKTFTYAQGYAAGLIDDNGNISDLVPVIAIENGKVTVGLAAMPPAGYTITIAIVAADELAGLATAEEQTFEIDGNGETALTGEFTPASGETKMFYQTKITAIKNK